MPALAKNQTLPLLAALALVFCIGGAGLVRFLMKYLARRAALNKRRQARLALTSRPEKAPAPKVQYTIFYSLPDLQEESDVRKKLEAITQKMNAAFPCLSLSLTRYGSKTMGKQALLSFLGKPDMSLFMTHCLFISADDCMALKLLLHSNLHKGEYYATGGPYARGLVEMACDLGVELNPEGKEDPMLQIVFLRFKAEVTDDSDIYKTFQKAVGELSKCPGIGGAALRPAGHDKLIKEDFIEEIQWNGNSFLATHCLTIAADSPQHLKDLQNSEAYGVWLKTEMPYLLQDGIPAAVIFYSPMKVTTKC